MAVFEPGSSVPHVHHRINHMLAKACTTMSCVHKWYVRRHTQYVPSNYVHMYVPTYVISEKFCLRTVHNHIFGKPFSVLFTE
jgi:hypothetical protein